MGRRTLLFTKSIDWILPLYTVISFVRWDDVHVVGFNDLSVPDT